MSLSIVSSISGCCILTATKTLFKKAVCTWPILADAIGFGLNSSKISSTGFENSDSIIPFTVS